VGAELFLKETAVSSAASYGRRVWALAILYPSLLGLCLTGDATLLWKGRLFVTLAQRSNVETLTLAFFLVFYGYLAVLSAEGAWGALRLLHANLCFGGGARERREARKARLLAARRRGGTSLVALNRIVAREGEPFGAVSLRVADRFGETGSLEFSGARLSQVELSGDGSNNLFAYAVEQVRALRPGCGIDIVEWQSLDDEETAKFLCFADFARNLERDLGKGSLFPRVTLTGEEVARIEGALAEICPALRNEAFLPDWEFQGEHKLPVIPEPLGIFSLGRREKRVDPLVSMTAALLVVLLSLALLLWMIWRPPWVPGM
jgi:hypothetical protein